MSDASDEHADPHRATADSHRDGDAHTNPHSDADVAAATDQYTGRLPVPEPAAQPDHQPAGADRDAGRLSTGAARAVRASTVDARS